jgi:hypothetical protein
MGLLILMMYVMVIHVDSYELEDEATSYFTLVATSKSFVLLALPSLPSSCFSWVVPCPHKQILYYNTYVPRGC